MQGIRYISGGGDHNSVGSFSLRFSPLSFSPPPLSEHAYAITHESGPKQEESFQNAWVGSVEQPRVALCKMANKGAGMSMELKLGLNMSELSIPSLLPSFHLLLSLSPPPSFPLSTSLLVLSLRFALFPFPFFL